MPRFILEVAPYAGGVVAINVDHVSLVKQMPDPDSSELIMTNGERVIVGSQCMNVVHLLEGPNVPYVSDKT